MHCNNLRLVLGLGLVRVSSRVRVKVRVSVLVSVSIKTSWVVNFALFLCYRPVIYTRPHELQMHGVKRRHGNVGSHYDLSVLWGNTAYRMKLRREDLSRYSNKIESASLRECPYFNYHYLKVTLQ